jgi:hypothetical protein
LTLYCSVVGTGQENVAGYDYDVVWFEASRHSQGQGETSTEETKHTREAWLVRWGIFGLEQQRANDIAHSASGVAE